MMAEGAGEVKREAVETGAGGAGGEIGNLGREVWTQENKTLKRTPGAGAAFTAPIVTGPQRPSTFTPVVRCSQRTARGRP